MSASGTAAIGNRSNCLPLENGKSKMIFIDFSNPTTAILRITKKFKKKHHIPSVANSAHSLTGVASPACMRGNTSSAANFLRQRTASNGTETEPAANPKLHLG